MKLIMANQNEGNFRELNIKRFCFGIVKKNPEKEKLLNLFLIMSLKYLKQT